MTPAGENPGAVVTRPFKLSTSKISLNADARNGKISIDVLDGDVQRYGMRTKHEHQRDATDIH